MNYNNLLKKNVNSNIQKILENPLNEIPNIFCAINISHNYKIALHPVYTFYWNELNSTELIFFLEDLKKNIIFNYKSKKLDSIHFKIIKNKRYFEILAIEHDLINNNQHINLDKQNSLVLLVNLGINPDLIKSSKNDYEIFKKQIDKIIDYANNNLNKSSIEILNKNNDFIQIKDKGGTYIGARMGRPEKAKMRKKFSDETNSQVLFPVGRLNEKNKNILNILKDNEYIEEYFRIYYCDQCKIETINSICETCKTKNRQLFFEKFTQKLIDLTYIKNVLKNLETIIEITKDNVKYSKEFFNNLNQIKNTISEIDNEIELDEILIEKLKSMTILFVEIYNENNQNFKDNIILKNNKNNFNLTKKDIYYFMQNIRKFNNLVYYKKIKVRSKLILKNLEKLNNYKDSTINNVKAITKTINKHHTVENIAKGIYRSKYNLYVNKDGTIRFDMTQMGITHFKPKEIGTSIQKLKELGYLIDYKRNKLENEDQIVEIFPQDVILPNCVKSNNELASNFIINTGNFIDDLLENVYHEKKIYNFKNKEDTIGHLVIGLAPHTSAGIVGRIIGYSKTQGCFAHPMWHAAQRRNLDGDENAIMLLLDGLINFSKDYLPNTRGSTMDTSLVLTSHINLNEIDDEVYGMDIVKNYPLEFYEKTKKQINPKNIKIFQVNDKLKTNNLDEKYFNYYFNHNVDNLNDSILYSSYKKIPTMAEKLSHQLKIAKKIRAVNEHQVAQDIIEKHFLKDIKGNLREFSKQNFRCTNCNTKYRRPPLVGFCTNCNSSSINFTVHEGSVRKYMNPSLEMIEKYNIDPYIVEVIELTNLKIKGLFGDN